MIYCLTGKIIKKSLDAVVISCGGVGYWVQIPATTGESLPAPGQEGTVYTVMNVTENDVSLYGFATLEQRDCFKMLTAVSGVGPKAGLSILSVMSPEKVALAASSGDHKAFTKASGVGPKLAQRIALELKDKVGKGLAEGTGFSGDFAAPAPSSAPAQAPSGGCGCNGSARSPYPRRRRCRPAWGCFPDAASYGSFPESAFSPPCRSR